MSVLPVGFGSATTSTAYQIDNSLRFDGSNDYLSRTFGTPTDATKFTLSFWVKRGLLAASNPIFSSGANNYLQLGNAGVDGPLTLVISGVTQIATTAVFRDTSAWYHIVAKYDNAATPKWTLYVNNVSVGTSSTANAVFNTAAVHEICKSVGSGYFGGYLSDIYFIDGQALTPSDFGETNAEGVWVPKAYAGTYGTNGFHLDFADGTSTTTLGYDAAGSNDWTLTGMTRSAGVNECWMQDTPTNNFATLNPIYPSAANITNGALASGTTAVRGTMNALAFTDSGAYWEVTAGASAPTCGVISSTGTTNTTTVTANKVFGFRLTNAGALDYINITDAGAWTSITTGLTGEQYPYGVTQAANWNFGQRALIGTPSGEALSTANLPAGGSVTTSGSFTGNTVADGPFVWLNGSPTAMTINGNAVTFGTHADKTAGGFKVRTSSASYNASGSNTYSITTNAGVFGDSNSAPQPAKGNP